MKQMSEVVHRIVLRYDDEKLSEHAAQEVVLQAFPDQIGSVEIMWVERTHGGVDEDGVPVQPRVEAKGHDRS